MKTKRIFLIVLDGFGIGALPDAAAYGDVGANTLKTIYSSSAFHAENLKKMGLFNIDGVTIGTPATAPIAAYGRMFEKSAGKDTTTGHWEISGITLNKPFPTYPNGFPDEVISEFEKLTGAKTLCNKPYSGTEVIKDYGAEHMKTGKLIVYTSADSVFQIAAHEDIVPCEKLYEYCRIARKILSGKHAVGRVIARPFVGEYPDFTRTAKRHDFSLTPPAETALDILKNGGFDVISIGKICDIFAGSGITEQIPTKDNVDGIEKILQTAERDFSGLCFANLVDFDMKYGHRNDIDGYAAATAYFDEKLPEIIARLRENDLLIITADHGCDPGFPGTDHTREAVPLLVYGKKITPAPLGTISGFGAVGKTIAEAFDLPNGLEGESFLRKILKQK